jgi:hypothetical protein
MDALKAQLEYHKRSLKRKESTSNACEKRVERSSTDPRSPGQFASPSVPRSEEASQFIHVQVKDLPPIENEITADKESVRVPERKVVGVPRQKRLVLSPTQGNVNSPNKRSAKHAFAARKSLHVGDKENSEGSFPHRSPIIPSNALW